MKSHPSRRKTSAQRGFSLVEIMISTSLVSALLTGVTSFLFQSLNIYQYDSGKLLVNRDIRSFTSEMTESASYANYFLVFPTFADRTLSVDVGDSVVGYASTIIDASLTEGQSGDFLLLVYTDPQHSSSITGLIGYYRSPSNAEDPNSEGPVRRFEVTFPGGTSGDIWDLLPQVDTALDHPEVVELSQGLADGKLFYNYLNRSIMVKGKIFHEGNLMRRATNTYNFTVSPRG
ncbi:PilW family protein [Synoicihabitans lomoniglobus]|uniref:Prepilin-type N-terminal cleavage/methylation domain-containing protein n=1 Tax=Synoicihabitans lomoniglobus TaxID=2909285 RepID=A0AAE9ZVA6_9BACT|nr:prepilin-type N-terminal cleavage/methylation domain-containing protein [Opitutaceae bacterium LMO-M01]WED63475.1 prepilin-type N-terminal cleavage/methylation domain-containing protein [Opitutaceae bacterium LMO-M01]